MIKNKKILITGGRGFIGSHLSKELSKDNIVKIFDIKDGKDIRKFDLLKRELKDVDYVFHLAALVSVEESMRKPIETVEININGGLNLLEASIRNNVKKIIFSSSSAVYGDLPGSPKKENAPLEPKSSYAISKIIFEKLLKLFFETQGLKTTSLRYFNVYGPGQDPNSQYAAVIPIFIKNALKNNDLTIYGDGNQRDFIFIKDVINANILAAESDSCGVFNIGSGVETKINDLAKLIIELTNSKSKIKHVEKREGDVFQSLADITEAKKLGFSPKYKLTDGLKESINWFKNNQNKL